MEQGSCGWNGVATGQEGGWIRTRKEDGSGLERGPFQKQEGKPKPNLHPRLNPPSWVHANDIVGTDLSRLTRLARCTPRQGEKVPLL